jgi:integrase/recombinase XerD
MTTTTSSASTAIAVAEPVFTRQERLALAGFLAGDTGLTRDACGWDLRQYASWCQQRHLRLFQARRADIECLARDLEARGRARATITRRLCAIAGFYRYAVEEELLEHSPAAHVRRPRLDRTGPQRTRCAPGCRRARRGHGARADLPARLEWAAGF